jgi:protein TonB
MANNDNLLLSLTPSTPRANRWLAASIGLHALLFTGLLLHKAPRLSAVTRPGDRNGHNMLLTWQPGESSPAAQLQSKVVPPKKKLPPTPTVPTPQQPAPTPAAPSTAPGSSAGTGNDALGDGQITLALQLQHPYPKPDLSKLPSGTRGDVIVDVVIDEKGHIAKFTMEHGLGHGIDETVLATIQQWTFQPATKNGQPVSSEQELLFHYERG